MIQLPIRPMLAAGAVIMALLIGWWWGRRPDPPPAAEPKPPTLGERDPAMAQIASALVALQARVEADQGAARRQVATDYGPAMIALVNSVLAQQGRPQIAVTATPEEVAKAADAVGTVKLTEETAGPGPLGDKVTATAILAGEDVRLLFKWHEPPPPKREPLFKFRSGTLYSVKVGGGATGNANLTLAQELAGAELQLDSTRIGWFGEGEVEHIWMSKSGKFWHGVGMRGGYQDAPVGGVWQAGVYYSPKLWIPSRNN